MKKKLLQAKAHFDKAWFIAELKVGVCLAVGFFVLDGSLLLLQLYDHFDLAIVGQLTSIAIQSATRAILTILFPGLFRHQSPAVQTGTVTTTTETKTPVQPKDKEAN